MGVQRAGYDHCVNILPVEQTSVIVKRYDTRSDFSRFVVTTTINVGDCNDFHIWEGDDLFEQLLSAVANANHAYADTIIGTQDTSGVGEHGRCPKSCLLQKISSCVVGHRGFFSLASRRFSQCCTGKSVMIFRSVVYLSVNRLNSPFRFCRFRAVRLARCLSNLIRRARDRESRHECGAQDAAHA